MDGNFNLTYSSNYPNRHTLYNQPGHSMTQPSKINYQIQVGAYSVSVSISISVSSISKSIPSIYLYPIYRYTRTGKTYKYLDTEFTEIS